jgi:hypothetical protein
MNSVASSMIFLFSYQIRRVIQFLFVLAFRHRLVLFLLSLFFEFQEIVESLWKWRSKKRLLLNSLLKRTKTNSWMWITKNCLIMLNVVACSCYVVVLLTLRVLVVRDRSRHVYRYVFDSLFKNFFLIILNFRSIKRNCVQINER